MRVVFWLEQLYRNMYNIIIGIEIKIINIYIFLKLVYHIGHKINVLSVYRDYNFVQYVFFFKPKICTYPLIYIYMERSTG